MAGSRGLHAPLSVILLLVVAGSASAANASGALTVEGPLAVDGILTGTPSAGALYVEAAPGAGTSLALDGGAALVNVTRVTVTYAGPDGARAARVDSASEEFERANLTLTAPHAEDARVVLESDAFHADRTTLTLANPSLRGVTKFLALPGERSQEADLQNAAAADYKLVVEEAFLARTTDTARVAFAADDATLYVYGLDLNVDATDGSRTFTTGTTRTGEALGDVLAVESEKSFLVVRLTGATGALTGNGVTSHWFEQDFAPHVDGTVRAARATGTVRVDGNDHPARDEAVTVRGALDLAFARTGPGTTEPATPSRTFDPAFRMDVGGDVEHISISAAARAYPAAATAAAVVTGLAGLAAVLVFWHQVKWWVTVAFLPLYSRLREPEILDNEARNQIYTIIRQNPGLSARAIHRAAEQSWGTVVYHLRQLERHHLVTSKRVGRSRNYYENHGKYRGMEVELATLKAPRALAVAEFVLAEPGLTQERLAELSGLPQPTASYYVRKLKDAGVIEEERSGRYAHYFPAEGLERLIALAQNDGTAANPEGQTRSAA